MDDMEYKVYKDTNDKITKMIEDNYLKDFHKAVKKFKIIMAGYNASKYKSLQVFKKYGWEMTPLLGTGWMNCLFRKEISTWCDIHIALAKNMKTGILVSDQLTMTKMCNINIHVVESDKLFELIKRFEKYHDFNWFYNIVSESIKCNVFHEGYGYKLVVYPFCSNNVTSYAAYATDKMLQNAIENSELVTSSYLINDILGN